MQAMENGLYWVWWQVKGYPTGWCLCRVCNGHVTAVVSGVKLPPASRLVSDEVPFMRLSARQMAQVTTQDTPESLAAKLEAPAYSPWHCMAYAGRATI